MESAALPAVLVVADTGRPSSVRARARRVHSVRYFSGLFTFCISTVLSRGSATKAAQYRSARARMLNKNERQRDIVAIGISKKIRKATCTIRRST